MGAMCTYYHWGNEKCQCFDPAADAERHDASRANRNRAVSDKTWIGSFVKTGMAHLRWRRCEGVVDVHGWPCSCKPTFTDGDASGVTLATDNLVSTCFNNGIVVSLKGRYARWTTTSSRCP